MSPHVDADLPIRDQSPPPAAKPAFAPPSDEQLRNRYCYHSPKGDQPQRYEQVRSACLNLALLIRDLTPCCPDQSLSLGALDDVMFRANAAIARHG